jgi:light-regulated signal transduction histidine kinase (bacteriophytochrome)
VQLLARRFEAALDGDARTFIGYAVDGAKRMKTLIDDLLAYSRLDGQEGAFVPTNCGTVLQRVLHDLREPILSSQAEISAGPLPAVLGNAAQLGQLFHHLLDNAIKFRSAHVPRVQISARQQEAQWVFAVRDNGIGMDPQYTERIFVMFQRLHNHAEYPGTGVGLAICKKVVERHGGRIWVESAPGQGATFFFTLPTLKGVCTEETSAISGERTQGTVGGG